MTRLALAMLFSFVCCGCGSVVTAATDASNEAAADAEEEDSSADAPTPFDTSFVPDVPASDTAWCPSAGDADPSRGVDCSKCPAGTICATQIGGVAGGGGSWCAPIPTECAKTPTCECMGECACAVWGPRRNTCVNDLSTKGLYCDDGIR